MRSVLSAAHHVARPFASAVVRASAAAFLMMLIASCHSETTAPAIPKSLEFNVQPANSDAVSSLGSIRVSALDASGHVITSFLGQVTVALGNNPGTATLGGTKTQSASAGVAVFSNLTVNRPGTGYTLVVSVSGGVSQTSAPFNIVPGPPASVVFIVQPNNATAGAAIAPAIQVQVQDLAANTVTTFNSNVTMTIGTNPAGGTLSGTPTVAASAGIATFGNLSIDKAGTGYKLTATAGTGSGQSNAFNVTAGTATQLVFSTQPTATAAGSNITPAIVVTAQDQFGNNATSFANAITIAITGGTGKAGAALSGTKTVTAVSGVATFSTLSIDSVGTGYTLSATATGLVGGFASATFNVVPGVATQLAFTGQPSSATAGANIAPAIVVTARDAKGNTATSFTGSVTIAIGNNVGGGTLGGTVSVSAVAGVASFSTININKSGTGYTLTAASGTLTGATSLAFNIIAGAATKLVFTNQPTNTLAAATINSSGGVQVTAQDGLGNTDLTFTGNVTVAFGTNAGGGTLSGTKTVAAAGGSAIFTTLSIDKVGTGYTLAATATGLTSATSGGFNIINSTATHLGFSLQPAPSTVAGVTMTTVTVTALDASNNTAIDFTAAIAVAIGTNPGTGTLSGTKSVAAVAGVATFSTLSIDKTGDGYTLVASAGSLTGATSTGFKITPAAASHLVFSQQPTSAVAGVAVSPAVAVSALDAFDNVDTAYAASVDIAMGSNPGAGTLSGSTPVTPVHGVATFGNLSINKSGTGYTLHATSGSLTDATSGPFNISAAALSQLIFTSQPVATQAGASIAPAITVTGEDAFGNTVTTFTDTVTIAIGTNGGSPTPGTLSGTQKVAAAQGVATFSNLSIDKAGSGYTLAATATGATAGASNAFDITSGAVSKLAFVVGPAASTTAGTVISPPITVAAQDAFGNTVSSFVSNITMAIGTNPSSGTLSGTTSITAVAGIATFSNLSVDKAGTNYTLAASASGLTGATSGQFNITASTATKLAFTVQPVNTTAGSGIAPAVQVSAQDALGNTDATFTGNVTVAITGGTGKNGAHLSGTLIQAAVAGVATFAGLAVDSAGTGYTLTASGSSLTAGTSTAFNITAGTATELVFGVQPASAAAGATIAPTVTVVAKDGQGNIDPSFTASVTLTLPVNPGGATAANATVSAVTGVATFSSLFLDKVGTGYKLQASGGALTSAQSSAFNITPGAATQLAFIQQPTKVTVGANINPSVRISAQDAFGNLVTSFANNVAIRIGTNPSGGTLTGGQTKAAVAGITTYSGLSINIAGNGYTLIASSTGLTSATSVAFNVIPSVAAQLFFTVQPVTTTAGVTMSAVTVVARDSSGQTAAGFGGNVTLSVAPGTGAPGATVGGTNTVAAVTGVATFNAIHIDKAASNYKLTATASGVDSSTSGFFSITPGTATQLVFSVQPSTATALQRITPQVEVSAVDALGNVDTSFAGSGHNVTVAISDANASGGKLSGDSVKAPVKGVAVFDSLSIDLAQTGHTLGATASGVTGATSSSFDITSSTASHLAFTTQPTPTTAGQAISPAVVVTAQDATNATLSGFTGAVTLTITAGTGTLGASLSGGTSVTVNAVNGVATFSNLSINRKGSGYKLSATAPALAGTTSTAFAINAGAASKVVFTNQPGGPTVVGVTIPGANPGAIQATIEDSLGNPVNSTASVSVSIGVNPDDGILSGTTTTSAVAGVASFADLAIDQVGTGYRLAVNSTGLTGDLSQALSITAGAPHHLLFTVAPSDTIAGRSMRPVVEVTVFDSLGNKEIGLNSGSITLAITSGTGTAGATLSGTLPQPISNGSATFNDLSIDKAGAGYTLSATSGTLIGTTSTTFNIRPGAATHFVFSVQPSNTAVNTAITPPIQVAAVDALGNVDTTFTGNVTMAIGTDAASGGGSVLAGTSPQAAVQGVATFNDLSINKTGTGFTLTAAGAFTTIISSAFNIF